MMRSRMLIADDADRLHEVGRVGEAFVPLEPRDTKPHGIVPHELSYLANRGGLAAGAGPDPG